MSGLVLLDAGALIALDRADERMLRRLLRARQDGDPVRTNPMALAQAWRDGRRQVTLAKALHDIEAQSMTEEDGRRAGELLAATGTSDPNRRKRGVAGGSLGSALHERCRRSAEAVRHRRD
jgi:hypothetical protein